MDRILIIGTGDIAARTARLLHGRYRLFGLLRNPSNSAKLRASGMTPLPGDLDNLHSLQRLRGLAHTVLHFAPPPAIAQKPSPPDGESKTPTKLSYTDTRTQNLLTTLSRGSLPQRLVYISTSGVYGDCGGRLIDETQPVNPINARARRRVDAEQSLRAWAVRARGRLAILRVPGIYASDRLPIDRLVKNTPALIDSDDVFTNHIHADDLAQIVAVALFRLQPNRVYHTVDDSDMKMAAYFDAVADAFSMQRPPRLPRSQLREQVSPMLLSFMSESRRLSNHRLKNELGIRLRYPLVADGLRKALDDQSRDGLFMVE